MSFRAPVRRVASALAALAMLFASLAPAVSGVLAAANDEHIRWTAVCTADGTRIVPVPTDATGAPLAPESHAIDHCPFCAFPPAVAVLPPPATATVPAVAGHDAVPPPFLFAPRPLFAWAAAQPRAPPFAS